MVDGAIVLHQAAQSNINSSRLLYQTRRDIFASTFLLATVS